MVIGGMASIPARAETLPYVIASILPQVDIFYIALNGYNDYPCFKPSDILKNPKIKYVITDNSYGDAMKFAWAEGYQKGYYCTFDDDLIVNYRHVDRLIEGVERYGAACSYHGRVYPRPLKSFMRNRINYRCLGIVKEDVPVDIIGTGCACFDLSKLKIGLQLFKEKNMADCFFAKACADQSLPLYVLKHGQSFFTYLPQKETIWRSNTIETVTMQTEILRSFLK
jgi:hypothetical protein